jgi:hypothetical protein
LDDVPKIGAMRFELSMEVQAEMQTSARFIFQYKAAPPAKESRNFRSQDQIEKQLHFNWSLFSKRMFR